jgi:hypothetical protein
MKKLILASLSAAALFGVTACSDSGTNPDTTTTQGVNPPAAEQPAPPPAEPGTDTMQPAPTEPAPAQ